MERHFKYSRSSVTGYATKKWFKYSVDEVATTVREIEDGSKLIINSESLAFIYGPGEVDILVWTVI